jgi:ornithine decarboxylase
MKTGFNGFGEAIAVTVEDEPMASLYTGRPDQRISDNVVTLR